MVGKYQKQKKLNLDSHFLSKSPTDTASKCPFGHPSSIRFWDQNSRLSNQESPPLTTIPGLYSSRQQLNGFKARQEVIFSLCIITYTYYAEPEQQESISTETFLYWICPYRIFFLSLQCRRYYLGTIPIILYVIYLPGCLKEQDKLFRIKATFVGFGYLL